MNFHYCLILKLVELHDIKSEHSVNKELFITYNDVAYLRDFISVVRFNKLKSAYTLIGHMYKYVLRSFAASFVC